MACGMHVPNLFHHVGHGLIITTNHDSGRAKTNFLKQHQWQEGHFCHLSCRRGQPGIASDDFAVPFRTRHADAIPEGFGFDGVYRQHHYQQHPIGRFGRKASKIGHHIEKAEELAHRTERQDARNTRHKKECAMGIFRIALAILLSDPKPQ